MLGLELEWSDVDRWMSLPEHLGTWSTEDYSIVNSDGHANDPTGASHRWGGEINTRPTHTAQEQAEIVRELAQWMNPKPVINYKDNLHVHVSPSVDILQDVDLLKLVFSRMHAAEPFVYSVVEPLPRPTAEEYPNPEELKGATKRWRRNRTSHQHSLSPERYAEIMAARTPQEFKDGHAPPTYTGGRAWHVAPRPGMNMRSLWKHGTIEFRHFPGTCDPDEVESAASWCLAFVEDYAIHGRCAPQDIYDSRSWKFPTFRRYDHRLQLGFEATKFKK